jgi:copper transport protein
MHRLRKFWILGVALLVFLRASPTASAHADFVSSTPNPYDIISVPPTAVTIKVSEAVQAGSANIQVTNPKGSIVSGTATLSAADPTVFSAPTPNLRPDVYTVAWSTISADDGHFTAGSFYFMVRYANGSLPGVFPQASGGVGSGTTFSALSATLSAASFVAFSVAFGPLIFLILVWVPASNVVEEAERATLKGSSRAILRFALWGGIAYVGTIAVLWAATIASSPAGTTIVGSTFLLSLAARLGLGVLLVIAVEMTLRAERLGRDPKMVWTPLAVAIVAGLGSLVASSVATHAAGVEAWWPLGPFADGLHLYGASVWVGGLLTLVCVRTWLRSEPAPAFRSEALRSFSRLALVAVILVVGGGILLAVILVGTINNLVSTPYGWFILAKSALLAPMVILGFINREPRPSKRTEARAPKVRPRVAQRVALEASLGAAVLVLAGILTSLNPAVTATSTTPAFTLQDTVSGIYGLFQVFPFPSVPQPYLMTIELWYANNGSVFRGATNASISFLLEGGNGTPFVGYMQGPHGNHFYVQAETLSQAGTWDIAIHVLRVGGPPIDFSFKLSLHG